jgi:putative glutamine amidotransferase
MHGPIIGITCDFDGKNHSCGAHYAAAVTKAGGVPMLLPCIPGVGLAEHFAETCDGLLFTGGGDPIMEAWGEKTHEAAHTIHADRQAFELQLFELVQAQPEIPVLAVCLGMQLMGLHAGGTLEQHLPESNPDNANAHHGGHKHTIVGEIGAGLVHSRHHQALTTPGRLDVVARSDDGLIEAIQDKSRPLYLGVQWHPERTEDAALGKRLIQQLVDAARERMTQKVANGSRV